MKSEGIDAALGKWIDRLRDVAGMFSPQERAAKMAGVSKTQFQRYLYGSSEPPFVAIAKFAGEASISLDWLAFGTGAQGTQPSSSPQIDEELLVNIIALVESEAIRRGNRPPPDKLAALVVHCYVEELRHATDHAAGTPHTADPQAIRRAFRLVG